VAAESVPSGTSAYASRRFWTLLVSPAVGEPHGRGDLP
jgi:hypothetical protein